MYCAAQGEACQPEIRKESTDFSRISIKKQNRLRSDRELKETEDSNKYARIYVIIYVLIIYVIKLL